MLEGNLCERCKEKVEAEKALHKQTRYCVECAKVKKRENTLDPWSPEKRRAYMREYMQGYRARARFCCLIWFLSFEDIMAGISYAELIAIKLTGLVLIVVLCVQHIKVAWRGKDDDKGK